MLSAEYTNVIIHIEGLVQGIGFRPHVYRTALSNGIVGTVENSVNGIVIHAGGSEKQLENFIEDLQNNHLPPAAEIQKLTVTSMGKTLYSDFNIVRSHLQGNHVTRISPDLAVCRDCLEDMKKQRGRINYPFVNCTNCGPRFSIIRNIPYDRKRTTMADFEMCDSCRSEFTDIHDRRFHAQPIACSRCGPKYSIGTGETEISDIDNIIRICAGNIDSGKVVALMGLGGYHLVCSGINKDAVKSLRNRKYRESKPFALMMKDMETIRKYAVVSAEEKDLLTSVQRPVVLLRQTPGSLPPEVNSKLHTIGVMLPYMPFHYLLFEHLKTDVLIMSSGNRSSEPIVISPEKAIAQFEGIADCIISHNRRIYNRVDDSVVFTAGGKMRFIRRSRGWVPNPILTDLPVDKMAAFGGELKSTFALGKKGQIIPSQHIGDLNNLETMDFFEESYHRFKRLFMVEPELFIHDLHPDYLSTRFAKEAAAKAGFPAVGVQHHEAHIASVIVEHGLKEPLIGVCYDGSGYGRNGTIWGGEVFSGWLDGFRREIHLDSIRLPGGDTASEQVWRTALSLLYHSYGGSFSDLPLDLLDWIKKSEAPERINQIIYMLKNRINCPQSSSMGRLFDGISALTGICRKNRYEAEAPMLLEAAAYPGEKGCYPYSVSEDIIDIRRIIRAVVEDIISGIERESIAAKFMNTVVGFSCDSISLVRERTGLGNVALSGGVFQNRYILEHCEEELSSRGFRVYSNSLLPANDGGIPPGQMGICAASGG